MFAAVDGVLLFWIVSNWQSNVKLNDILFPFTADPGQFLATKILSFCVNERRVHVTYETRQLHSLLDANYVTRDRKYVGASIWKSGCHMMTESGVCCHPTAGYF